MDGFSVLSFRRSFDDHTGWLEKDFMSPWRCHEVLGKVLAEIIGDEIYDDVMVPKVHVRRVGKPEEIDLLVQTKQVVSQALP